MIETVINHGSVNGTAMEVESVESAIDPRTGYGMDHVTLSDAKYDRITIKRVSDDEIEIKTIQNDEEETLNATFEIQEKAAQVISYNRPRRELDDDLQDALLSAGYTVAGSDSNV